MSAGPYFVILGAMRTGSNYLEKTLAGLGDTVCHGEAFNPAFLGDPRFKEVLGWTRKDRDADPLGYLHALIHGDPDRIAGFRLFDGHSDVIRDFVTRDPACRVIVLRRDPVDSFVSLQIARQTGQWLLTDERRRMRARMHFDAEAFEVYRDALDAHYAEAERNIAAAGTPALQVRYEALSDPAKLREVAGHIGSRGTLPDAPSILRQNPGSLADKVSNYREMCAYLGVVPEARPAPVQLAGARDVLVPDLVPLAYAPIAGPGFVAAISLIDRLGQHKFGVAAAPWGQTTAKADLGELHPSGLDRDALAKATADRPVFALVCHPLVRRHRLFLSDMFGRGWRYSAIRRHLVTSLDGWPEPKKKGGAAGPLTPETHLRFFLAYLAEVAQARKGEGAMVMRPDWASQQDLIAAYRGEVRIDRVARLEDIADLIDWLSDRMGVGPVPGTHARVTLARASSARLPLDDVLLPDAIEAVRALDHSDHEAFGYADLPDTQIVG